MLLCIALFSNQVLAQGCLDAASVTPVCTDNPVSFAGGVNQTAASTDNPNVNYGCLLSTPNPAWYYLEIATTGTLSFDIANSAGADVDWATWGPFTDLANVNANCASGAAPFDAPIDCDYTTAGSGTLILGTVTAGEVYVVLVANFGNSATDISMATTAASSAATDCSIVPVVECAATCADAAANSCNVWETTPDVFATSYTEIQTNGGESCFGAPLDVSTATIAVTQCWEYTHTAANSTSFTVLAGTSVIENNNTNGTTDCEQGIDNIEVFDASCTSLIAGGQGVTLTGAVMGTTYTVCATGSAGNGTAEGQCDFTCMVSSVTPLLDPVVVCGSTVYDSGGDAADYANNENITETYCPDMVGDVVTINFTSVAVESCCDNLGVFDGTGTTTALDADLIAPASFTSTAVDGCITITFGSDGSLTFAGWAADITCAPPVAAMECAATCTDAAANTCNVWETTPDVFATSYTEIETNGGVSCFVTPIDVSTADMSVTQCWEYTHTAANSTSFTVLAGTSVIENNSTNGTTDCTQSIDNIEIFDASCTSLMAGVQGTTYASAVMGTTYTVCITGTAGNGTAEGQCDFNCMASSVTPLLDPVVVCGSTVYDSGGDAADYGANEAITTTLCPDTPGDIVSATFTFFSSENNGTGCWDGLTILDGDNAMSTPIAPPGGGTIWCTDRDDALPNGSGDLQGMTITSTDASGCLTFVFTSDGTVFREGYAADITCAPPAGADCAATCADAAANACNVYETPAETPAGSYTEIQTGGGESCFSTPIDVSTADMSVTQCWEYTHNTANSSSFFVLSGTSVVENNDVNGTTDCTQSIDNIEIFDPMCVSLASGGQGTSLATAVMGTTYTICVTGTAGNGTAEGQCDFNCMAHSVTPEIDPVCAAIPDFAAPIAGVCSGGAVAFDAGPNCANVNGPAGTGVVVDLFVYAPGGVPSLAAAAYESTIDVSAPTETAGNAANLESIDVKDPSLVAAAFDATCAAPPTATAPTNLTCAPFDVTYFMVVFDYGLDSDQDLIAEYAPDCTILRFDVTIWPAPLTVVTTGDGGCGDVTAELQAADGTVCESAMGFTCALDGDALTYDFSTSATALALAGAPVGCVLPASLSGIVTCGGCPVIGCDATYAYAVEDVCSGTAPTFTIEPGCVEPGGSVVNPNQAHLDLDWYMYAPGGVPGEAPVVYDPMGGLTVDNSFPISNTDLAGGSDGLGGTWNGVICADLTVGTALTVTNNTCAPITVTYFALPWSRLYDTDGDGSFGEYNIAEMNSCFIERYDVVVYPAPLTVVTTGDAACGTLTAELQAGDGTVCESMTAFTCTANGETASYDFSTSATVTALAASPAACAVPAVLSGTLTCAACPVNCTPEAGTITPE